MALTLGIVPFQGDDEWAAAESTGQAKESAFSQVPDNVMYSA
jgi:hypothetical protein